MLIICAGMARSGSTVQYQIVCEIIESLGLGMTMGWVNLPTKEFLDNLESVTYRKDKFLVIKSHNYSPQIKTLVETGKVKVIYVYRDLRDVTVSLANKFAKSTEDAISRLSYQLNNYYLWTDIDKIMVSKYENMVADLHSEVLKIADYLEITVNIDLVTSISNKLELNQQKQRIQEFNYDLYGLKGSGDDVYDPVSQLHNNHINSGKWGQWKDSLSQEQIEFIENWAFSWFMDRGYPLSTIIKDENQTAITHSQQARQFLQHGKYLEAEYSYKQAILANPNAPLYHYGLGSSFLKQNKVAEAINAYRHALHLNPNSALFHHSLGVAFAQKGSLTEAITSHRRALEIKPDVSRFYNSLGEIMLKQKKLKEAEECFQKAIKLSSKSCWPHANMAKLLNQQGKSDLALDYSNQASILYPDYKN